MTQNFVDINFRRLLKFVAARMKLTNWVLIMGRPSQNTQAELPPTTQNWKPIWAFR